MDFLSNVLGIGSNIKNFLKTKVPKLWGDAGDEIQQHAIRPAISFAKTANNTVQRTAGAIGDAGIKYGIKAPIRMAETIGQGGLDRVTGKKDLLPYAAYAPTFMEAPKTNIAKGLYNMGAGFVNAVGSEGIVRPTNDLVQGVADLAYKNPIEKKNFQSGAFKLGHDLASGAKPQEFLADAAQTILPILNAWTGGKAKTVFEGKALAQVMAGKFGQDLQRQALKKIAVETSKTMGKLTGAFTGLQALIDNQDKTITEDIVQSGLAALGGYAGGRVLGFATPYAGREASGVVGFVKNKLKPEINKVVTAVINGEKTTLAELQAKMAEKVGKFAGYNTVEDTNKIARELWNKAQKTVVETKVPYTPQGVTANLIQKTEGMPVGNSIKNVSNIENPFPMSSVRGQAFEAMKRGGDVGKAAYDARSNMTGMMSDKSLNQAVAEAEQAFKSATDAATSRPKPTAQITPETPQATPNLAPQSGAKSAEEIIASVTNNGGKIPPKPPKTPGIPAPAEIPGNPGKMANAGINTDHLLIGDEAKATIDQAMKEAQPQMQESVGKVMSKEEVVKAAEASAKTLKKTMSREEVLQMGERALNLRQEIATEAEKGTVTPELIELLKADKEFSSANARLLQQRSIDVSPGEKSPMLAMIDLVNSKVDDIDAVLKAAEGVDFNDANQSAIFYRQFIKPKVGDWVDLLRYNSMLSSPLTHIVNIGSNLVNSGVVAPIEKTFAGGIDFLGSKITGNARGQFAGEGASFAKGYVTSIGDASHRFADVMRGVKAQTNLDTRGIPLHPEGGIAGKVEKGLSVPLRLLEGMDQFFTVLTEGGERSSLNYRQGKGVKVANLEQKVQDSAAYRIYRQDLHAEGQGTLLDAVDTVTGMVMKARNSENGIIRNIAKWTVPFIKTPTNIFKQGLEYSPVGFATVYGAGNKVDQLAKAAIGSSIFAGAAMLSGSGRLTWAEPINEKERNAFRAAGLQPYSVKLGDTWYSYQKLPPGLSFSLAMVAAIEDTQKNAKLDDGTFDQIVTAVAKYGTFLSDQSYAKSIGDLLSAAKGGESGIARLFGNYPQQLVPYRALSGWLARITDDVQRKIDPKTGFIDKQVQMLMQNIPGLSDNTMARTDEFGNEILNNNNIINAFSPVRTSEENPQAKERYDGMTEEKRANSLKKQAKESLKTGGNIDKLDGKSAELTALGDAGNYIFAYDLEKYIGENKETGIRKYTHQTDKATVARNIMEGTATYKDIPDEVKPEIYKAMGLDEHDVEYDYMASQPTSAVAQYLSEEMRAANLDHNSVVRALVNGRRSSISGKMMVSNAVVDEMYKGGFITTKERTALKKVKLGQNGENQAIASGGSGGARKKSVSALVTALKNIPKVGGSQKIDSTPKKNGTELKINKPAQADTTLSTKSFQIAPLSLQQIFNGTAPGNPMAGTNIAKAKAMVAGSGGGAPGTGLKLSQSFYRGRG